MLGAITGDVVVADWLLHDAEHTYQGLEDHWFMYCGDKKQGLCRCRFGWTESEGQGKRVQCGGGVWPHPPEVCGPGRVRKGDVACHGRCRDGVQHQSLPAINTSFPHPLPNLFVEIGYDIRRRAFDNADAKPAYFQDFGLRPGLDISLSERVHLFFRFSFSGYQWSLADSVESHSWTLFRHDFTDRTVGVFFYF